MDTNIRYFKGRVKGDFETVGHHFIHIGEAESDYTFHNVNVNDVEVLPIKNKAVLQNEESFDADTIYDCNLTYNGKTYENMTITNCIIKEFTPNEKVRNSDRAAGSFEGIIYGEIERQPFDSDDQSSNSVNVSKSFDNSIQNRKGGFIHSFSGCLGLILKSLLLLGLLGILLLLFDRGCSPVPNKIIPCDGVDTVYVHDTIYVNSSTGQTQKLIPGTSDCNNCPNSTGSYSSNPLPFVSDTILLNNYNNRKSFTLNRTDLSNLQMSLSDYWENDGDVVSIFLNDKPIAEYVTIDENNLHLPVKFINGKNKVEIFAHSIGQGSLKIATPILTLNSDEINKVITSEVSLNEPIVFYLSNSK